MKMEWLLQLAAIVGLSAALAALYGRYRVLPSFLTGPNICRLEQGGCQTLFRTPQAALLGVPNAALGVPFYLFLLTDPVLGWPQPLLFAAASMAFLMSLVLAGILVSRRLECRICWTGHLANLVIWIVLLCRLLS